MDLYKDEYYSYRDLNKQYFIFKVKCYTCIGYQVYDIIPHLPEYKIRTEFLWNSELQLLIKYPIHNFTHLERLSIIENLNL